MRLTQWTDYTLRVLMYCAACRSRPQPVTISEIADTHGISRSHLTKIVQELAAKGMLETTRGRGGGIRLLMPAEQINLGEVVRATETDFAETDFALVECFDPEHNRCLMINRCDLQDVLERAIKSFLAVLDAVTLADLVPAPRATVALPMPRRMTRVPGMPPVRARSK